MATVWIHWFGPPVKDRGELLRQNSLEPPSRVVDFTGAECEMAQDSLLKSVQPIGDERRRSLEMIREVSETIGTELFCMLVKHLRRALGARCVYVCEFVGRQNERARTLAASMEDDRMESFEFPLAGTPDAEVARARCHLCTYSRGVREMFPADDRLRDLEAEAWVGIPLNNAEGQACGLIAALYSRPLDDEIDFVQSTLTTFAPRASAELNRKREQDKLQESEQRYRAFIERNPDAFWRAEFEEPIDTALPEHEQLERIARTGYVAECNDALAQVVGLERGDQLIGAAITEVVPSPEVARSGTRSLIRSGYRYSTVEISPVDQKGHRRYLLVSHWGIVEKGKLQRVWGSVREITEFRVLEAQFRHAQRLEAIGKLAGGVAHDFNNLLAVIQGYSSHLLEHTEKTSSSYVGLTEILKAAEQGAALTKQLLAFSRKQSVRLEPLNLNAIVAEDERMLQRLIGLNIELVTDLEPSLGLVLADAGYIHQILLNLAVNARDAMPNGGKLSIALLNVDIGEVRSPRLSAVVPGAYVELIVADTGVGMSEEVQEHLFEPFFTTKDVNQGTGLGLFTVYGIVRQIGGHIVVETELNKGTKFEIFMPRVQANAPV
jgi:signal transduction histidine kinase